MAFDHISGAEPSTVTFKAATISMTRNSSKMHQEIISIGDPVSSLGVACVLAADPNSTVWGLVTRPLVPAIGAVSGATPSYAVLVGYDASGTLTKTSPSTPFPVTTQGVDAFGAPATANPLLMGALTSSTPLLLSSVDNGVVYLIADYNSRLWTRPYWSSSGVDQPVRPVFSSTSADNPVLATITGTPNVRPVFSSTNTDNPVRAFLSSTSADNPVNATLLFGGLQSSVAGSSGSSGVLVRPIIDNILTVASTNAFASTALTIQSSAASIRTYVTAYSILSTNAGPNKLKFYDGSSLIWPVIFAAPAGVVSGANLAASPPGYLFRGSQGNALTLNLGSTLAGFHVAVSYFRAP